MTDLQILRNALFDELSRVKRGTSTTEDTKAVVSIANQVNQSYLVELKATQIMMDSQEKGIVIDKLNFKVFEKSDKVQKDYINSDE